MARKGALPVLALALLCAAALSGCASGGAEDSAVSSLAHAPLVGGVVSQLKQEDDEKEQEVRREHEPQSPEERAEAREQAEAAPASSESESEAEQPEGAEQTH